MLDFILNAHIVFGLSDVDQIVKQKDKMKETKKERKANKSNKQTNKEKNAQQKQKPNSLHGLFLFLSSINRMLCLRKRKKQIGFHFHR